MFAITAGQLLSALVSVPSKKEFELREQSYELVRSITRHELELLAFKCFVEGMVNKKGLQYIRLTVDRRKAVALLRRMISRGGSTVAEDSRTISRHTSESGSVIFSHRRDMVRVWQRKHHGEDGSRAILVVPRTPVKKKRGVR